VEVVENKRFVYEFGKFILDPNERTLIVDETPIHLPAKEFDTLLLLIEHNGRAQTKEEMISAIWQDTFVEEGNLAKQISRLRKIINTDGEDYIETVPKLGYRFKADLRRTVVDPEESVILEKRTVKRFRLAVETDADERNLLYDAPKKLHWQRWTAIFVLLTAVISAVLVWRQRSISSNTISSVAVLPLQSIGNDENERVLGLGLTDELITKLGSLKRIVVPPLSAVASSPTTDPREIGRMLDVDAILVGTVQRADGRLRVKAQLIRTTTGEQVWAERFEQASAGIFDLQDDLSAKIARALAFQLTRAESSRLAHHGTANVEAYETYLRGRYYQYQNSIDGLQKSIEFFEQATARDPSFADAYAGIADSNTILFNFGFQPANETIPRAREAVNRALQLNPDLPDAYVSQALIQFVADRNWPAAKQSLDRAIELNPSDVDAYLRYGYFLGLVGDFDEALDKLEKARTIDPLSSIIQTDVGLIYLCSRRYPLAIEQLTKVVSNNPSFSLAKWFLASSYDSIGERDKAFELKMKAMEDDGLGEFATQLRKVKEEQGLDAAYLRWFETDVKNHEVGKVPALAIAEDAAALRDRDQTLFWLEKAVQNHDAMLDEIKYVARYDFVRDDERFKSIVDQVGF